MCWHFSCLQMSTFCLFVSLLEHYQCFPRKDVCLIFVLGSVSRNTVPGEVFPNTVPREQEVYWMILWSLLIISCDKHPCCQRRNTSLQRDEYWQLIENLKWNLGEAIFLQDLTKEQAERLKKWQRARLAKPYDCNWWQAQWSSVHTFVLKFHHYLLPRSVDLDQRGR